MDKILQLLMNNKQKKKTTFNSFKNSWHNTDYRLSKQYNTLNNKTTTKLHFFDCQLKTCMHTNAHTQLQ